MFQCPASCEHRRWSRCHNKPSPTLCSVAQEQQRVITHVPCKWGAEHVGVFPCQTLVPSALQAGRRGTSCHGCPVPSTHKDAELLSTLVAPRWHLRGHSDNRINFLITLVPVPISGKPPRFDMGSQSQEEEPDCAAQGCLSSAISCLFLKPWVPVSSIWHVPPEGAASHSSRPPNPPQAGIPPITTQLQHALERATEQPPGTV